MRSRYHHDDCDLVCSNTGKTLAVCTDHRIARALADLLAEVTWHADDPEDRTIDLEMLVSVLEDVL